MAFCQKVPDLDKFTFTSQFRLLPMARLDSSYHTYDVTVESTRLMRPYLRDMDPEKSVYIEGWKWLNKGGHISVQVKLEDMLPEAVSVKERVEILKDRSGKQTGTRTYYRQEVIYTFSAWADVSDYKGGQIGNFILANREYKQTYASPEFAVRQMAEGYFLLNTLTITQNLYKSCVQRAMRFLSARLTENFGYGVTTVNDHMWIVDSRKHPEYDAHRKAFLTVKDALFSISPYKPLDGVREQVQPAIDYFNSIKKRYTSSSKHDRKIRYASYFNLAVLYYYLDDPQAMLNEASGLILNDFDSRDGKGFEQTALNLKNLFEQTQMNTRHFTIDTSVYRGPNERAVTVK
jgi:hypothetical protein